jgi:hypothetical protein
MPFAGLLRRIWTDNFEGQFKYRDERHVNARGRRLTVKSKNPCAAGISLQSQSSIYRPVWDNDNHCRKAAPAVVPWPQGAGAAAGDVQDPGAVPYQ